MSESVHEMSDMKTCLCHVSVLQWPSHLMGIEPKLGDPKFEAWDEEYSMIIARLSNLMIPEISDTCMIMLTAKDI